MAYVEMVVPNAEVQFGGATDTTALVTCMGPLRQDGARLRRTLSSTAKIGSDGIGQCSPRLAACAC
jgi:hypothetical protein